MKLDTSISAVITGGASGLGLATARISALTVQFAWRRAECRPNRIG